jgi:hypothetical protein
MLIVKYKLFVFMQRVNDLMDRNRFFSDLISRGTNPPGLTSFRNEYICTMRSLKSSAEKRLGASLATKARSHTTCWKVLNRLRCPSTAVAIDAETLIEHFENIFFDRNEPILFDLPALGIPCPSDFCPRQFTDLELVMALNELNAQAAVGPQRISSNYIKKVFSSERATKNYQLTIEELISMMISCVFLRDFWINA